MPDEALALRVEPDEVGLRLDVFLARRVEILSRSQAKRMIDRGEVRVDGRPGKPRAKLKADQLVELTIREPQPTDLAPEAIPLDVVYEDPDLLVVNKPAGMLTHPGGGEYRGTLVNALLAHCQDLSGIGGEIRPGIVHRLDRDTTGLLVVAKHDLAHRHLADQLRARTAGRRYLALIHGVPEFEEKLVDAPLARHRNRRTEMAVDPEGRRAVTQLHCLERYRVAALLAAELQTGRTHQVRVHCTLIGHPLLGDRVYGRRRARALGPLPPTVAAAVEALSGQALHAARLTFRHPRDGREMVLDAPPPPAFRAVLDALREDAEGV